jgi:hypothetical protein
VETDFIRNELSMSTESTKVPTDTRMLQAFSMDTRRQQTFSVVNARL